MPEDKELIKTTGLPTLEIRRANEEADELDRENLAAQKEEVTLSKVMLVYEKLRADDDDINKQSASFAKLIESVGDLPQRIAIAFEALREYQAVPEIAAMKQMGEGEDSPAPFDADVAFETEPTEVDRKILTSTEETAARLFLMEDYLNKIMKTSTRQRELLEQGNITEEQQQEYLKSLTESQDAQLKLDKKIFNYDQNRDEKAAFRNAEFRKEMARMRGGGMAGGMGAAGMGMGMGGGPGGGPGGGGGGGGWMNTAMMMMMTPWRLLGKGFKGIKNLGSKGFNKLMGRPGAVPKSIPVPRMGGPAPPTPKPTGWLSKMGNFLKKVPGAKLLPKIGKVAGPAAVVALAASGVEHLIGAPDQTDEQIGAGDPDKEGEVNTTDALVRLGTNAAEYASYGALLGSVVPGVGTLIGGAVGGTLGLAKTGYQMMAGSREAKHKRKLAAASGIDPKDQKLLRAQEQGLAKEQLAYQSVPAHMQDPRVMANKKARVDKMTQVVKDTKVKMGIAGPIKPERQQAVQQAELDKSSKQTDDMYRAYTSFEASKPGGAAGAVEGQAIAKKMVARAYEIIQWKATDLAKMKPDDLRKHWNELRQIIALAANSSAFTKAANLTTAEADRLYGDMLEADGLIQTVFNETPSLQKAIKTTGRHDDPKRVMDLKGKAIGDVKAIQAGQAALREGDVKGAKEEYNKIKSLGDLGPGDRPGFTEEMGGGTSFFGLFGKDTKSAGLGDSKKFIDDQTKALTFMDLDKKEIFAEQNKRFDEYREEQKKLKELEEDPSVKSKGARGRTIRMLIKKQKKKMAPMIKSLGAIEQEMGKRGLGEKLAGGTGKSHWFGDQEGFTHGLSLEKRAELSNLQDRKAELQDIIKGGTGITNWSMDEEQRELDKIKAQEWILFMESGDRATTTIGKKGSKEVLIKKYAKWSDLLEQKWKLVEAGGDRKKIAAIAAQMESLEKSRTSDTLDESGKVVGSYTSEFGVQPDYFGQEIKASDKFSTATKSAATQISASDTQNRQDTESVEAHEGDISSRNTLTGKMFAIRDASVTITDEQIGHLGDRTGNTSRTDSDSALQINQDGSWRAYGSSSDRSADTETMGEATGTFETEEDVNKAATFLAKMDARAMPNKEFKPEFMKKQVNMYEQQIAEHLRTSRPDIYDTVYRSGFFDVTGHQSGLASIFGKGGALGGYVGTGLGSLFGFQSEEKRKKGVDMAARGMAQGAEIQNQNAIARGSQMAGIAGGQQAGGGNPVVVAGGDDNSTVINNVGGEQGGGTNPATTPGSNQSPTLTLASKKLRDSAYY